MTSSFKPYSLCMNKPSVDDNAERDDTHRHELLVDQFQHLAVHFVVFQKVFHDTVGLVEQNHKSDDDDKRVNGDFHVHRPHVGKRKGQFSCNLPHWQQQLVLRRVCHFRCLVRV